MTADTKYTKVGCGLFSWEPYLNLRRASSDAAHLWQVFYMGQIAKMLLPGLWVGGVGSMADHGRLTYAEALRALETCEEHQLVEYDPRAQVLRLTRLPDKGEAAPNPNCLKGWWERRKSVPDCGVRERHLELMAWLHLPFQISKRSTKEEMIRVWEETFGAALAASSSPNLSTAPSPNRSSPPTPSQLDLYATPMNRNGYRNGYPNGSVMGEVKALEEGEVQEREAPATAPAPAAAALPPQPDDTEQRFKLLELDKGDAWMKARAAIAATISPQNFQMWIEPLTAQVDGDIVRIIAPTDYHRKWVKDHYGRELENQIAHVSGRQMRVAI